MIHGPRTTPDGRGDSSLFASRADVLDVECPTCVGEFTIDRAVLLSGRAEPCPDCGHECGIEDLVNDD